MKKCKVIIIILSIICVGLLGFILFSNKVDKLPKPEITGGERGTLGIDKNINETNIDKYLGRSDAVYRDVRMLEDPADYSKINGDSYLSGFVKGFEVISLPYIIPVVGLPEEVGNTYKGKTLFRLENDKYIANYKESMDILEYYFPKDKIIFIMCGGGGYAGMTKSLLVSLGWDTNKIYNVGGYWYYNGNNKINVKREIDDEVIYDFWKVTYHDIDFSKLTEV